MPGRVKLWRACQKPKPGRLSAPHEPTVGRVRSSGSDAEREADDGRRFRSRPTQRMRSVSANSGFDRRSNVPESRPKSNADRSRKVAALAMQLPNAFCRLTLELSRPVAGRRTCASVAQSTWLTPRHGVGLNDLLGGKEAGEGDAPAHLPKDRSPDA